MHSFRFGRKKAITYIVFKNFIFLKTITKQVMTAYTNLQIIHIVTDVHIRARGLPIYLPAGSTCLSFLSLCISVFDSTGGLNVHARSNTNTN